MLLQCYSVQCKVYSVEIRPEIDISAMDHFPYIGRKESNHAYISLLMHESYNIKCEVLFSKCIFISYRLYCMLYIYCNIDIAIHARMNV